MYRGGAACMAHSLTPAIDVCGDCGRSICEDCEVYVDMVGRCRRCGRRRQSARRAWERLAWLGWVLVAVLVSISGGIVLGIASNEQNPPPIRLYGP